MISHPITYSLYEELIECTNSGIVALCNNNYEEIPGADNQEIHPFIPVLARCIENGQCLDLNHFSQHTPFPIFGLMLTLYPVSRTSM